MRASGDWPQGLLEAFGQAERLSYVEYSAAVLYGEGGYYRQQRPRVGTSGKADFMTNLAVRSIYGRLVAEVVRHGRRDPANFAWVEMGVEPEGGVWRNAEMPFALMQEVRWGEWPRVPDRAVVFANEWLDAYPFCRLVFRGGQWWEVGVQAQSGGGLIQFEAAPWSPEAFSLLDRLPRSAEEGYRFDYAPGALVDLQDLLSQKWEGGLILCDYGRSWKRLTEATPLGTARAYRNHRQVADLLETPGKMDLTTDVCWDDCRAIAEAAGFGEIKIRRQEVFFMEEAAGAIRTVVETGSAEEKSRLRQLLSPAHFGGAFQVMSGWR